MKAEVIIAVDSERVYQEHKHKGHEHTPGEWLLIMEKCLEDAKIAWCAGGSDRHIMEEVRQVTAVGVAAMEQHGAPVRHIWL